MAPRIARSLNVLAALVVAAAISVGLFYWLTGDGALPPRASMPPYPGPPLDRRPPDFQFDATLELGEDLGQNLGTLFEAYDNNGRLLCGAGFVTAYQTRRIVNNRALEFYCRTAGNRGDTVVEDLGPSAPDAMRTELVTCAGELIDVSVGSVYGWADHWLQYEGTPRRGRVQNIQTVNGKPLFFVHRGGGQPVSAFYEGRVVVESPGDMMGSLYYGGVIYFVTRVDGSAKVFRCRWSPSIGRQETLPPLDLGSGFDVYAMIGYGDSVFIGGGMGSIFRVRDGEVIILRQAADPGGSEFYSFVVHGDRLLAGHYISGYLHHVDIDNSRVVSLGYPPLRDGQYGASGGRLYREAQSVALYCGDLYVGEYPWGHLWRLDADTDQWHYRRMFQRPEFSGNSHPYRTAALERMKALKDDPRWENRPEGLECSAWAQRISSLIPFRQGLAIGLGSMRGLPYVADRDTFLTEEEARQYGHVKYLKRPHSLISELRWNTGPTRLSLASGAGYLRIMQDGKVIAWAKANIPAGFFDRIDRIEVGRGVFGPSGMNISDELLRH